MHDPDDELVPRAESRRMLGRIGREKQRELERSGKLRIVRLSTSPKGRVFHIMRDIKALMVPEVTPPGPAVVPRQRAKLLQRRPETEPEPEPEPPGPAVPAAAPDAAVAAMRNKMWGPPPIEHAGRISIFKHYPDHVEVILATRVFLPASASRRGSIVISYWPRSDAIAHLERFIPIMKDGDFKLTVEVAGVLVFDSELALRPRRRTR